MGEARRPRPAQPQLRVVAPRWPDILNRMTARRDLAPLSALAILFAITIVLQVRFTYDSIDAQIHVTEVARPPFGIPSPQGTLAQLQKEAVAAGVGAGGTPGLMGRRSLARARA